MGEPARKTAVVVELKAPRARRIRGHVTGRLVGRTEAGEVLVDYPGNPHGPLVARTTVLLGERAGAELSEVLLVFEGERSNQPVVVGVLRAPGDKVVGEGGREALVDGRRVVIDAVDEIVLRCGEASITLRRNGRVVIRGAYVETRSRGVNRVKGGSVQIN
jgi:hypothetical protein